MTDDEERLWINGNRAAYRRILSECLRNLDAADIPFPAALAHLEDTRAALRRVCAEHGDNDWDDRLHLADVIEEHLRRHLNAAKEQETEDARPMLAQIRELAANWTDAEIGMAMNHICALRAGLS